MRSRFRFCNCFRLEHFCGGWESHHGERLTFTAHSFLICGHSTDSDLDFRLADAVTLGMSSGSSPRTFSVERPRATTPSVSPSRIGQRMLRYVRKTNACCTAAGSCSCAD